MTKTETARTAAHVRATAARFDRTARKVFVDLGDYTLGIPLSAMPHIADATDEQLDAVQVIGAGNILHWEELDADYSVSALAGELLDPMVSSYHFARRGGMATTERKKAAARENGKRGGRPRLKRSADDSPKRVSRKAVVRGKKQRSDRSAPARK